MRMQYRNVLARGNSLKTNNDHSAHRQFLAGDLSHHLAKIGLIEAVDQMMRMFGGPQVRAASRMGGDRPVIV